MVLDQSDSPPLASLCDLSAAQLTQNVTLGKWRITRQAVQHASLMRENSNSSADVGRRVSSIKYSFQRRAPSLYEWLGLRLGTPQRMMLVGMFIPVEAMCLWMLCRSHIYHVEGEDSSLAQAEHALSFLVCLRSLSALAGLFTSFLNDGRRAIVLLLSGQSFVRLALIALLFDFAISLKFAAYSYGATEGTVVAIGYIYLPASALLGVVVMQGIRVYGTLEWLSLFSMTFAAFAFIDVYDGGESRRNFRGHVTEVFFVALSATASVLASTLAERIFKHRSRGILETADGGEVEQKLYIFKTQLDLASFAWTSILWCMFAYWKPEQGTRIDYWDKGTLLLLAVAVCQGWLAAIVTRMLSTVTRALMTSFTSVVLLLGSDLFRMDLCRSDSTKLPKSSLLPCTLLTLIVLFAALVFQTGRVNFLQLRDMLGMRVQERRTMRSACNWDSLTAMFVSVCNWESVAGSVRMYGSMVVFVIADALRTLSQQYALSRTTITPVSMVLACYFCGIIISVSLTITSATGGLGGCINDLRQAFSLQWIVRYLPSSFFFAAASTLLTLAYANGISGVLGTALGYTYMPLSALASYWFLGKYYIWLEWIGLCTLTLASCVFGIVQTVFSQSSGTAVSFSAKDLLPMLFVVGSACSSVCGSLAAERVMKQEDLPFHIQKVRLDIGSMMTAVALLPLIGWISARPQDAFWKERPLDQTCWKECLVASSNYTCSNAGQCQCPCGQGIFVAWYDWRVVFALMVNVGQSWLNGKVIKQFSTVLRAVAQSSTILVIYFIGEPLLNGATHTWPLTLVACLVPLSTATFMVSVSEMEKVMDLRPNRALQAEPVDEQRASVKSSVEMAEVATTFK